ncbi:MAG: hypothetical protein RLZZ65_1517 [Bacteroidota bacterium]|jgi:aminopeptidase N
MKIYFSFFISFLSLHFLAQTKPIDIIAYRLELKLADHTDSIYVKEHIALNRHNSAIDTLVFDFFGPQKKGNGMTVSSVNMDGKSLSYQQSEKKLRIRIPKRNKASELNLEIEFAGIPADGLVISNNLHNERTFFADNWPNRAQHWYACIDHPSEKARYEFIIEAPAKYQVVANGNLLSKTPTTLNTQIWHYQMNQAIPTKVAVIGCARLVQKEVGVLNDLSITASVYPQDSILAFKSFETAAQIVRFYQHLFGPYPFDQLNNVQSTTRYGGMENAGCIFYDEASLNATLNSSHLIAHEIAHQWFGNSVTESDWQHLWLSEGFATYLTNLYIENNEGQKAFHEQLKKDRIRVTNLYNNGFHRVLVDSLTPNIQERLNANAYQKGAWVLHMLRQEMGDSLFFKGLSQFHQQYQYSNASSQDFIRVMSAQTSKDLSGFFKQWLYQERHPVIKAKLSEEEGQHFFELRQLQKEQFQFSLKVAFYYDNGEMCIQKFNINDTKQRFSLPKMTGKTITKFQLDPNTELLFEEVR